LPPRAGGCETRHIGATLQQYEAPEAGAAPRPERAVALPSGAAAHVLALQRSIGNRGVTAMIQRLSPAQGPIAPEAEPGGNLASAAEEAAGLAAEAQRRANARRLLPAEIEELDVLPALIRAQGPGLVLGTGTTKLLNAVDGLGSKRAGATSAYVRDPASAGALPSFVLGSLDDPDGRITVTADGLLEVMKTKRVQPKAKKGQPPPPPKVTHDTALVDLKGKTIKLSENTVVGELFLSQAQTAVESEARDKILKLLRESDAPVQGGSEDDTHLTLGELVAEAASGVYTQRKTVGSGVNERDSDLLLKVKGAFDELYAEFKAWQPPAPEGSIPDADALARAFAAKLQPTLFSTTAAAQAELDQVAAALATAQAEAAAAKAALTALKGKTVAKAERAAHTEAVKAAQERKSAADKAVTAAKSLVKSRTRSREGLVAERDKFAATIAWILSPSEDTRKTRAGKTVGSLCNVLSFYLSGKAIGLVPAEMDFKDYYLAEIKAGRIRYYKSSSSEGVFWGEGSTKWEQDRNLIRLQDDDGDDVAEAIGDPSRRAELEAFLAGDHNVAITHQDLNHTPPVAPHHFMLIVKGPDGVWRNMDHTSTSFRRRGAITDWNRVFRIEVDAALIAQARSEVGSAGP
jgi:hypothetical protein